jgi:hypothetical protein
MSSVRFTNDSLSSTTFPTETAAYHWGGWSQVRSGGYGQAADTSTFAFGRANTPINGFIFVIEDAPGTEITAGIFTNDFINPTDSDFQVIITGSNTNWFAWILQYSGSGTVYTLRWRFENATTWNSINLDCGAVLTSMQSIWIGDDQFGEPAADVCHKGIWCAAGTLSDAAALTASQNARQGITPVASPLHWLDLDSSTNVAVNGGSAGNWTPAGSPATDASEPVEGATYTLTAAQGGYTLTGRSVTLNYSANPTYTLAASGGNYSYTGFGGNVSIQYQLVASGGTYALSGQIALLKAGRRLTSNQGSYTLSGQSVNLRRGWSLAAAQGTYALSGQAALLKAGRRLAANQGSYTLSGFNAALLAGRKLVANQGSYGLSGQAVNLTYTHPGSYTLTASGGSYTLSGQVVALKAARRLAAAQGVYTLTGLAATVARGRTLLASGGTFSLSGQAVGLKAGRILSASHGNFSLTGLAVGLTRTFPGSYVLSAQGGVYGLTGQALGLLAARRLQASQGAYTLSGNDTTFQRQRLLTASVGTFTLSGQETGLKAGRVLRANGRMFTLLGMAINFGSTALLTPKSRKAIFADLPGLRALRFKDGDT